MKRTLLKGLSLLVALMLTISQAGAYASTAASFSITINGQQAPTPYLVQEERLLVPAVFFRQMGIKVTWDEQNQAVLLQGAKARLSLPSGQNTVHLLSSQSAEWKTVSLPTTTTNKIDGTYIPLRYAAEVLGIGVSFAEDSSKVMLKTGAAANLTAEQDELHWLYQITEAEAGGEGYQGKLAVAATILNRVKSPDWPNSIKEVIFQVVPVDGVDYYQFSPVLDKRIYEVKPDKETIKAVHEALEGKDPTNRAVVFFNPDKTDNQWVRERPVTVTIGNHVFAK